MLLLVVFMSLCVDEFVSLHLYFPLFSDRSSFCVQQVYLHLHSKVSGIRLFSFRSINLKPPNPDRGVSGGRGRRGEGGRGEGGGGGQ